MRAPAPAGARKYAARFRARAKPEPGFSRDSKRIPRELNLNDHLNSTNATGLPLALPHYAYRSARTCLTPFEVSMLVNLFAIGESTSGGVE